MEQRHAVPHAINKLKLVEVGNPANKAAKVTRCGLPLGKTMYCGDARHRQDLEPDREVISGGESSNDVWFIRSGILRLQRYSYEGRRQILALFLPGEIVGFEGEFHEGVSVETATQSSLCRINRRWFNKMMDQNDDLRAELFGQKQDQLDWLHWLTWSLGALTPEERLCAFLALSSTFMPYQPFPDGTGILSMDLPRRDIADLLETTVETISRVLHKLADSGIIEIRDPAHFHLRDLHRLIARGKIDGLFDRMTIGLAKRRNHLEGIATRRQKIEKLVALGSDNPLCFCGG